MQTITTKGGTVVNVATRADMTSAVPTVYLRAYRVVGKQRLILDDNGEQTVIFKGDYPAVKDMAQPLEVRVREHAMILANKVPLDDVQAAAAEAARAAERG
jgi:hypothetical protein